MIEGLLDKRNTKLFEAIRKNYTIKVELVSHTNEYGCYSIDNTSIIYVPESNIAVDYFSHELLHIYLRSKEIYFGARLKRIIQSSNVLSNIYSASLLEHIGNCLDHIKMLPIYLDLGFDRHKFLSDYEIEKCTKQEVDEIKKYWQQGFTFNPEVIDFYLVKYFAVKACPNRDFDYQYCLQMLEQIDEILFSINEKIVERCRILKLEPEERLEEDYKIIVDEYVDEMEGWLKSKKLEV